MAISYVYAWASRRKRLEVVLEKLALDMGEAAAEGNKIHENPSPAGTSIVARAPC